MTGTPLTASTVIIKIVFSTKEQRPLIRPEIEPILYDKISKILFDECYSPPLIVGGDKEHVHILYAHAHNLSVDHVVRRVKDRSSQFIRKWLPDFAWQESYAAVTVSRSEDEIEKDYIRRQKEVHETLDYKDEFRKLLHDNNIAFIENELWE